MKSKIKSNKTFEKKTDTLVKLREYDSRISAGIKINAKIVVIINTKLRAGNILLARRS